MDLVDVVVVGGGPAGLTAALYAARARAKTIVFESAMPGGQITTTDHIENYPGFPEGLSGAELGELMRAQAERHGAELRIFETVNGIRPHEGGWAMSVDGSESLLARTVIVATGAVPRKLDCPGEAQYTGRGVSWCAVCDGALYRGKTVAVIGGGDSAVEEAIFLTKFAAKVYVIHRRDELRATKCIQERCLSNDKIEMRWNRTVAEIIGDGNKVTSLRLASTAGEDDDSVEVDGVFIYVGIHANSELLRDVATLNEAGFVVVGADQMTSEPGLFAAGDVTNDVLKQVVTAAGQGATAAFEAVKYLDEGVCTI